MDVDEAAEDARQFGIGPIPAMRIVSSEGHVLVEQDGFLPANELLTWLKSAYKATRPGEIAPMVASGPPDAAAVEKLIAALNDRSVVRREAAMRRLAAHPPATAVAVADALQDKKLAVRLAALEMLAEWRAPVDGLDPWQPDTMTADRLQAVRTWAEEVGTKAASETPELLPEQWADARQQLDRFLSCNDDEAAAIVERLARFGSRLVPPVAERLSTAEKDRDRERLLTLRYRLVASDALVLQWPAGLKRLAAVDVQIRRQAAEELAGRAVDGDQALLLELFSDADPLRAQNQPARLAANRRQPGDRR